MENNKDNRLYADPGGKWYYITKILEDGDEKRIVSSNSLSHIQESATRFSTGEKGWEIGLENILLVDGETHHALAFYAKETGLLPGWQETSLAKSIKRKEAYKSGKSLIEHSSSINEN